MSRRIQRDTHKRVSSTGYQQMQGDVEVQGNLIGPAITSLSSAIAKLAATSTTPVKLAAPVAEGIYKSVILKWTKQYNLSNLDYYEVQVSLDDLAWYSLKMDGGSWGGDNLGATTQAVGEFLVHPNIPFIGTVDDPTGRTLYYRVRQHTKSDKDSPWSDSTSAVPSTVQTGDLAANSIFANNIIASEIEIMLMRVAQAWIGYGGTGTFAAPAEGDRRIFIDGDEIRFQVFALGAWSTARQITFGGTDVYGSFLPFLSCRGLLGDMGDAPADDPLPNSTFSRFSFDDAITDQYGVDPWTETDVGGGTLAYSAAPKWEGTKSLYNSVNGGTSSVILHGFTQAAGSSCSVCFMYYISAAPTATPGDNVFNFYWDANNCIYMNALAAAYTLVIIKGGAITTTTLQALSISAWHCIGMTYDSVTNTATVVIDGTHYVVTPAGAWGAANGDFYIYLRNKTYINYFDDLIVSPTGYVSPDFIAQHYQLGRPWEPDIGADDVLIQAQTGGRVRLAPNCSIATLASYANNAAAVAGGLRVGDLYRLADTVGVVH